MHFCSPRTRAPSRKRRIFAPELLTLPQVASSAAGPVSLFFTIKASPGPTKSCALAPKRSVDCLTGAVQVTLGLVYVTLDFRLPIAQRFPQAPHRSLLLTSTRLAPTIRSGSRSRALLLAPHSCSVAQAPHLCPRAPHTPTGRILGRGPCLLIFHYQGLARPDKVLRPCPQALRGLSNRCGSGHIRFGICHIRF